jgi:hypothetical protein
MYLASLGMWPVHRKPTAPLSANLTDTVTGIIFLCKNTSPDGGTWTSSAVNFGYPSFLTSLALNVLLTLMVIARLVLHSRSLKSALGPLASTNGLYKTILTMLVESFALYTVSFLLFIGSWSAKSYLVYTFFPILVETQVRAVLRPAVTLEHLTDHFGEQAIAPLLIISQVINRSTFSSDASSGETGSIHFRSQRETARVYGTFVDENPMSLMGGHEEIADEPDVGLEVNMDEENPPRRQA